MERSSGHVLQGTPAILTKIRRSDLGRRTAYVSWDARALGSHFDGMARWWAADLDPRLADRLTALPGRVV